jgi:hypothetical protein
VTIGLWLALPAAAQLCGSAETACGLSGVTVVVSPACAAPGELVEVRVANESNQTITLPTGCTYVGVTEGRGCGGPLVFGPACTLGLVPIPPGTSYAASWLQNGPAGAPVPPGTYSFEVWYYGAGLTNLVQCCAEVTLASDCSSASAVPRNGGGTNPSVLASLQPPALGSAWVTSLDCSAHAPGLAHLFVLDAPASGPRTRYGEVLVGGRQVLARTLPHAGSAVDFSVPIPARLALCGRRLYAQGLCGGAPRPRLSNALDLVLFD